MRLFLIIVLLASSYSANSADSFTEFKIGDDGQVIDWRLSDARAIRADTEVRYEEQVSVKIDNDLFNASTNYVLRSFPLNFEAETIEIRARIRTKDTGAFAGANIFLRQDISGNAVEFTNSQPFVSARDNDWHKVRVSQAVNSHAESIVIGAFLAGPGAAWFSDVEFWVDGKLITELPASNNTSVAATERSLRDLQEIEINWQKLDVATANDLARWMKVWGFFKYFHPEVALGTLDWDFIFVESVQSLVMGDDLNDIINAVLAQIGVPEESTEKVATQSSHILVEPILDWYLNDEVYDSQVIAAIESIWSNRNSFGESVYAFSDQMALPVFAREKQLSSNNLTWEIRLLVLARLWNVLEYWFPYREEIQSDWYGILSQLTLKTLETLSEFEFKKILEELLTHLNDGHAGLSEAIFKEGSCYLPFTLRRLEADIIISRIHKDLPDSNVLLGDRIIAINGQDIDALIEAQVPYFSASNDSHRDYSIANGLMARSCEQSTVLTLSRDQEYHQVEISEYEVPEPAHSLPGQAVQTLDGDVTYLKVAGIDFNMVDQAIKLSRETGKLIIDVRGYPSEFILYYLGNQLTQEPLMFARLARIDPAFPGRLTMLEHTPTLTPQESVNLDGIVILVDEASISQSEFSVMAWRELPNTTIIGSTTAGAIGNVRIVPLMDGLSAYFTGLRVYDKNGDDVQYVGIVPDIYIRPTPENLRAGRDVIVEKAIEFLNSMND
ncbi:MAG: S41 family peptidase [Gammaproteobacteria bacterium]|nr:S41 family peptidase [Gammaproteobacteria bacterium]